MAKSTAAAIAALTLIAAAVPASAATKPRVLLAGDSITEALTLRKDSWETLATLTATRLRARGRAASTARGWVPIHDSWTSTFAGVSGPPFSPWVLSGPWLRLGFLSFGFEPLGPEGMVAIGSNGATATLANRSTTTTVMYTARPGGGSLTVSTPSDSKTVSASARTATAKGVTVTGSPVRIVTSGGPVAVSGALEADGSRTQLLQTARPGAMAIDGFAQAQQQARKLLRASITVILFGTNEENRELVGSRRARSAYDIGLMQQAKMSRPGRCIVVPHAPNNHSQAQQRAFRAVAQRAAKRINCRYRNWLAGIWDGGKSKGQGFTFDGIHPTRAGYQRLADALARGLAPELGRR